MAENRPPLWDVVGVQAPLWPSRLHGEQHANRVAATGLELAQATRGADPLVVFLFGLFHDCRRQSDRGDPGHGDRAATYLELLHASGRLGVADGHVEALLPVIRDHSKPVTSNDPTAGCCLDADRLNLLRLRREPDPRLLSTAAAAGLVEWTRDNLAVFVPWETLAAAAGYPL